MRIESTPSSAVPLSVIAHAVRPGAVAFPCALHEMPVPLSVPCAVPVSFRSPAHVALNDPRALVDDCSLAFHLKSLHALGEGMMFDEDQLPDSAPMPLADGPVSVLFRSKPIQPAVQPAKTHSTTTSVVCFMSFYR